MESGGRRRDVLSWLLARRPERGVSSVAPADGDAVTTGGTHRPRPSSTAPILEKTAQPEPSSGGPSPWSALLRKVRSLAIVALIVVAGAFLLRTYVVETYYIPSASMEPTLHGCPHCNDDRVLVEKLSYLFHDPQPGDVVVFNRPSSGPWARNVSENVLIKRIIGVGGDRIVIRHGHVFRDGQRLIEPYVNRACTSGTRSARHVYRVPPDEVFLMGDNRCDSEDSRVNGPIPDADIVGRAFVVVWPLGRWHSL